MNFLKINKINKKLGELQLFLYINRHGCISISYCKLMVCQDVGIDYYGKLTEDHIEKTWRNIMYSTLNPIDNIKEVFKNGCGLMYHGNYEAFEREMNYWNSGWKNMSQNRLPKIKCR